jgi:hypothetical protein
MHYVRSGDFVVNLFRDARNADELAFAVGALSHYVGDAYGHSMATNRAVPVEFPKLGRKYGKVVSFADGEDEHVRTEFAFDIDEIAHHRMAPARYLRHIGLQVPTQQLSQAFYQTYGLSEKFSGIRRLHINESEYRFAVRTFIPRIAYAVTLLHRRTEPDDPTDAETVALHNEINAMATHNEWDKYRSKAGIGTYMLAGILFIVPKIGPLKLAAVKGPTEQTDALYDHSLITSVEAMRRVLARFTPPAARRIRASKASTVKAGAEHLPAAAGLPAPLPDPANRADFPGDPRNPRHPLEDRDLDTGYVVRPGGYRLTDATFAELLHVLTRRPSQPVPPGIKSAIEEYYANLDLPIATKKDAEKWQQVLADLGTLKTMPTNPEPQPYTTYDEEEQE